MYFLSLSLSSIYLSLSFTWCKLSKLRLYSVLFSRALTFRGFLTSVQRIDVSSVERYECSQIVGSRARDERIEQTENMMIRAKETEILPDILWSEERRRLDEIRRVLHDPRSTTKHTSHTHTLSLYLSLLDTTVGRRLNTEPENLVASFPYIRSWFLAPALLSCVTHRYNTRYQCSWF